MKKRKGFGVAAGVAAGAATIWLARRFGWWAAVEMLVARLGKWAIPAYVGLHTLVLAVCPPYAVVFEAGAPILFGFGPGVACVFSAKILGASLSFALGRAIFRSFKSAREWAEKSKYFHLFAKGVEQDGWKFVLLARFSPLPSYIINYVLAATNVGFFVDFLLPTIFGCLPMILQNVSVVSLANAAVSSTTGAKKSSIFSYLFPLLGIASSALISWRIKQYSSGFAVPAELSVPIKENKLEKDETLSSNGDKKRI